MYTYSENFILPHSHDEVVHGKKSLINKMFGTYEQKFSTLRAFYGYMMALPGKKLLFMGGEFGQFIEWRYDAQLEWFLLEYESHGRLKHYVRELNHIYLKNRCLWQLDHSWDGFEWIQADDADNSVISFLRRGRKKGEYMIVISNFTPVFRHKYQIRVPTSGEYYVLLHSDYVEFGGATEYLPTYKSNKKRLKNMLNM